MTHDNQPKLPAGFEDLERFVAHWAKPTERERHAAREDTRLEEADAFYSAIFPRMEAVLAYLSGHPASGLAGPPATLLHLAMGAVEASLATEIYRQPTVINGFDRTRIHFL